jgi:hypothetical protein
MHGLTNVAIVFQDEASFFEINQANDAIDVSQKYIAKSDPYLIVVSTPNRPGDMLNQITEQSEGQMHLQKNLFTLYYWWWKYLFTKRCRNGKTIN